MLRFVVAEKVAAFTLTRIGVHMKSDCNWNWECRVAATGNGVTSGRRLLVSAKYRQITAKLIVGAAGGAGV